MKLVCVSDTHNKPGQELLDKIEELAPGDDRILIHAGDLVMFGDPDELERANEYFGKVRARVRLLIPGNHEKHFQRDEAESRKIMSNFVTLIDEEYEVAPGVRLWGTPWTPEFYDWAFMAERGEEIQKKWDKIPDGVSIVVSHGPLMGIGTLDRTIDGRHVGCADLRTTILKKLKPKPKFHISGHIHSGHGEFYFKGVHFVNASICDERYKPVNPPIVLDIA